MYPERSLLAPEKWKESQERIVIPRSHPRIWDD